MIARFLCPCPSAAKVTPSLHPSLPSRSAVPLNFKMKALLILCILGGALADRKRTAEDEQEMDCAGRLVQLHDCIEEGFGGDWDVLEEMNNCFTKHGCDDASPEEVEQAECMRNLSTMAKEALEGCMEFEVPQKLWEAKSLMAFKGMAKEAGIGKEIWHEMKKELSDRCGGDEEKSKKAGRCIMKGYRLLSKYNMHKVVGDCVEQTGMDENRKCMRMLRRMKGRFCQCTREDIPEELTQQLDYCLTKLPSEHEAYMRALGEPDEMMEAFARNLCPKEGKGKGRRHRRGRRGPRGCGGGAAPACECNCEMQLPQAAPPPPPSCGAQYPYRGGRGGRFGP